MDAEHGAVVILSRGRERGAEGQASEKAFHGPYKFVLRVSGRQKDFVGVRIQARHTQGGENMYVIAQHPLNRNGYLKGWG